MQKVDAMASSPLTLRLRDAAGLMRGTRNIRPLWQMARGAARRRILQAQLALPQADLDRAANADLPASHYGRNIQILVAAVQMRTPPKALGAEYELLRGQMDLVHYYLSNNDVAQAGQDAIANYILIGAREGRNPTPLFNSHVYRTRYPQAAASNLTPFGYYLKTGRAQGHIGAPLKHHDRMAAVLGLTPQDALDQLAERTADIRSRLETGVLGEMVEKAAHFDPLIRMGWRQATQVRCLPFSSDLVLTRVAALHEMQTAAGFRRARAVVVLGHATGTAKPEPGNLEQHLIRALARRFGGDAVLVISTDPAGPPSKDALPPEVRVVDFIAPTAAMGKFYKLRPLVELIRSLRPEICINADSAVMWDLLKVYGKPLTASVPVVGLFDRFDPDVFNNAVPSTAQYFYRYFDLLQVVCSDSPATLDTLADTFCVPPAQRAKLLAIEPPFVRVQDQTRSLPAAPKAIWVCTLTDLPDAQTVFDLARSHPDLHIDIYTIGLPATGNMLPASRPANVSLHRADNQADVSLSKATLLLAPGTCAGRAVFRAIAVGLPVAMPAAMRNDLELTLPDASTDLNDAVTTILADPSAAKATADQIAEQLSTRRSRERFEAQVDALLAHLAQQTKASEADEPVATPKANA